MKRAVSLYLIQPVVMPDLISCGILLTVDSGVWSCWTCLKLTRHILLWCVPTRHVPQTFRFRIESSNIPHYMIWLASMYGIFTHVWLIFYGKCRQIYHTWMVWDMSGIQRCNLSNQIWLIKLSSHWTSTHTVILYTIPVVILVYQCIYVRPNFSTLSMCYIYLHWVSPGIPVRLCFWTCKVVAVADSWFIHWPMLVIYRCTYTNICIYIYIYICCFFCVQPKLWPMTLAKGIWVGCLGKHEWRLTMTSIRFATNSAPKWINHDQRWEGQKLCGSSSTDWRPKSYHWTLATTIQGVAHLEMLGRTCLKGICRI